MIKRYDLINVPCHGGWDSYDELQEVEDGDWVRYEDHAAEVKRLRDTFDRTRHQVCDALEVDRGLGWTSLCMEITRLREALQHLVDEVDDLVGESAGVTGLHLNGDVAPWDELLPGGRFERLSSLDRAREAVEVGR